MQLKGIYLLLHRLVKFGSQKNCPMLEMMSCLIRFLSNGRLLRLCTTTSTRLPVMSGVMAVCSMRSGALDAHPSRHSQTKRSVQLKYVVSTSNFMLTSSIFQVIERVDSGFRLPPPPGCPKSIYQLMIQCW